MQDEHVAKMKFSTQRIIGKLIQYQVFHCCMLSYNRQKPPDFKIEPPIVT